MSLKKEKEAIKSGSESKERRWDLVRNVNKKIKRKEEENAAIPEFTNKELSDYILKRDKETKERIVQFFKERDEKQLQVTKKAAELKEARRKIKVQNKKRSKAEDPSIAERENAAKRLKRKEMKIENMQEQTVVEEP